MAENLRQLNSGARTETRTVQQQPERVSPESGSEIYHSLEDAVPFAQGSQPEQMPTPASTIRPTPPPSANGANVLLTGQVCRYVSDPFVDILFCFLSLSPGCWPWWSA